MENYVKGKVLGKGSFGTAVLAVSKLDGKNYVIKEVELARMPKAERDAAEQEARLLLALKHPNIVRCKECFTSGTKLCIVMDWCSEGDLYSIMQQRKGQQLPEDTLLDWFVQICLGLKHVHDRKILHRDIKTQNIFVSSGGLLKLGDFGVSKVLNGTFALATTAVGTPYYLSPEICQNRKYNQKSDIWSLGCVLYELATMRHAFEAPNMRALIQKIIKGSFSPLPPSRSPELRQLISMLLTLDAKKRPNINEVLALPFIRARIARFLNQTLQQHEFSHTVIHGRPEPGQLVVALSAAGSAGPAAAAPDKLSEAAAAAAAGAGDKTSAAAAAGGRIRLSAPAAMGPPQKLLAAPPVAPKLSGPGLRQAAPPLKPPVPVFRSPAAAAAAAPPKPARSPSNEQLIPARGPSPPPAAAGQQQQRCSPVVSPLISPRGASPREVSPRGAAAVQGVRLPSPRDREKEKQPAAGVGASVDPVAAARQRALVAQQERQAVMQGAEARRAAEAEAAAKAAADALKQRQAAAVAAAAEVAKLRAADERQAAEAAAARLEAERKKAEARQLEEQRKLREVAEKHQKAEAEAAARRAAEEDRARIHAEREAQRRAAEDVKAKARVLAEAERRQAAVAAREREREQMHQQMQRQKQEFLDRQSAAAANRRRAEEQMRGGVQIQPDYQQDGAAADEVQIAVAAPRHRKPWSPPRVDDEPERPINGGREQYGHPAVAVAAGGVRRASDVEQPVGGRRAAAAAVVASSGDELSAQQRRQVWEEMRAAAERNKQQLLAAQGGGLAAFLGVPADSDNSSDILPHQQVDHGAVTTPAAAAAAAVAAAAARSPHSRRQQQQQPAEQAYYPSPQQQQPQRQRVSQQHHNQHRAEDDSESVVSQLIELSPWELRRKRLEAEQAARDEQLRQFQRQHWLEVKQAAARNKQQVLGELGVKKQQQQQQQQQQQEGGGHAVEATPAAGVSPRHDANQQQQQGPIGSELQQQPSHSSDGDSEGTQDFAAMLSDMQDLVQEQQPPGQEAICGGNEAATSAAVEGDVDDDQEGDTQELVVAGRFMLEGREVQLPVSESDSLALKVEALRMYLEEALGTKPFLKVYHRLEELTSQDDEEEVSQEFLRLLGTDKLSYVQLVNQLIVAEETMHLQHAS